MLAKDLNSRVFNDDLNFDIDYVQEVFVIFVQLTKIVPHDRLSNFENFFREIQNTIKTLINNIGKFPIEDVLSIVNQWAMSIHEMIEPADK